jgi:hypothetical protein
MQRLLVAVGVIALLVLAAAQGEYKEFLLNAERYAEISGDVSFVALTDGTIKTNQGSVEVYYGDRIILYGISDSTSSGFKIWVENDGWIDIENLDVQSLVIEGKSGRAQYDNVKIIYTINIQVDVSNINSSLTIRVPSSTAGWTQFVFNGTEIINGESSDEIIVEEIKPSNANSLYIDAEWNYIYAKGVARTAYVNGSEVPEIGLAALGSTAVLAAALLLARRVRPVMSHVG